MGLFKTLVSALYYIRRYVLVNRFFFANYKNYKITKSVKVNIIYKNKGVFIFG